MTRWCCVVRALPRWLPVFGLAGLAACGDPAPLASPEEPEPALARRPSQPAPSLAVTITRPASFNADVRVTGPKGFTPVTLTQTATLSNLKSGTYTLSAANVVASGITYVPTPVTQAVNVGSTGTFAAAVTYAAAATTGSLRITVNGLDATPPSVTVTGPNAYSRAVTVTPTTLSNLVPGTYTIAASAVTSGSGVPYAPTTTSQNATVSAGNTVASTVTYAIAGIAPGNFNLAILGVTLTQSVQTFNNAVPLVAGRAGVLRVFAVASASNSATPQVRARLYLNGALMQTLVQGAPATSTPTALNEGSPTASWNFSVPAELIQPGLSVLVDVDPSDGILEANEEDNSYPLSETPLAFTVRTVAPLSLRFVPVTSWSSKMAGTTVTGAVSGTNAEAFLGDTRDMLPVGTIAWDVRSPYTTANTLYSNGDGWLSTLTEVSSLRTIDGRPASLYYGVVKAEYGSGVVGIGYVGDLVSMGWDNMPGGIGTMAHELGHNFGRFHAPCGGPRDADPNYPYAGGTIGVYGWNVRTNTLVPSSRPDLMTYCADEWISDYNYSAIMSRRGFATTTALSGAFTSGQPRDGLLVWGRVAPDGNIVLEPAFALSAPVNLPPPGGTHALEAIDASGRSLFSMSFTPTPTADGGNVNEAHFSYVIPLSREDQARVATVRVRGNGREAVRTASQSPAALAGAASAANISAVGATRARLQWDAVTFPMVIVRETDTGDVLSFARGGDLTIVTNRAELDIIVTDGVRSAERRIRVRGR